jgi:hypothetical protein
LPTQLEEHIVSRVTLACGNIDCMRSTDDECEREAVNDRGTGIFFVRGTND